MANVYAPYQQLQPIQEDFGDTVMQTMDYIQRQQAQERAAIDAARKRNMEAIKDIADFTSNLKLEDVKYHFNDQMLKFHQDATQELYDLHKEKQSMVASGVLDNDRMRAIIAREEAIKAVPGIMKQAFEVYNKQLVDFKNGVGKPGGYDDVLNTELMAKFERTMAGTNWNYDYQSGKINVKDPKTGDAKQISFSEFMQRPMVWGQPERFVDVDEETKKYASFIGAESQSYPTEDGSQITIKRSKVSDPESRKVIYDYLNTAIDDDSSLMRKVQQGELNMTKREYINYIMNQAGIKEDVSTARREPADYSFGGSKQDYYSESYQPESTTKYSVYEDGVASIASVNIQDKLDLPRMAKRSIQPREIVNLGAEGSSITLTRGETEEVIDAFKRQDITSTIEDFFPTGLGKMYTYNGGDTFTVSYEEDGETFTRKVTKGSVVPDGLFEKEGVIITRTVEVPASKWKFWTDVDEEESPSSSEAIIGESTQTPMIIGSFGKDDVLIGVPINEKNSMAVSNINTDTKRIKAFAKDGIIADWTARFETGAPAVVPTSEPTQPTTSEAKLISDYPDDVQAKIQAFAKSNNLEVDEAISILIENQKL